MKDVGDLLVSHARTLANTDQFDQYARSAFNRYYYSAYLAARAVAEIIEPGKSGGPKHSHFPAYLRGHIRSRIIKLTKRNKSLTDKQKGALERKTQMCISQLAGILSSAYPTRVEADYSPDTKVTSQRGLFILNGIDDKTAANWSVDARKYSSLLEGVWNELKS